LLRIRRLGTTHDPSDDLIVDQTFTNSYETISHDQTWNLIAPGLMAVGFADRCFASCHAVAAMCQEHLPLS